MKNKKSLLGLGLLALVLVLGVGYAVVSSQNLSISGTASVAASTLDVVFTEDITTAGKGTTTATKTSDLAATISVTGLTEVGDVATATYTIKNNEKDLAAEITKASITNNKEAFFKVTTTVDSTATTIAKEGTATVTVTVELIKMPIEESDSTATISVNLLATPVQPTA